MGIGGAPEEVITAAALRCLDSGNSTCIYARILLFRLSDLTAKPRFVRRIHGLVTDLEALSQERNDWLPRTWPH